MTRLQRISWSHALSRVSMPSGPPQFLSEFFLSSCNTGYANIPFHVVLLDDRLVKCTHTPTDGVLRLRIQALLNHVDLRFQFLLPFQSSHLFSLWEKWLHRPAFLCIRRMRGVADELSIQVCSVIQSERLIETSCVLDFYAREIFNSCYASDCWFEDCCF